METSYSKADLHIHTTASDGAATVRELLAHVARTDLRVIAVTDHDTISAALEAQQMAGAYGVEVIVGEEVSTQEGHLLVLFLEQELPPGRPLAETVAAARAQGALVIAPHPFGFLVNSLGRTGPLGFGRRAAPAWATFVDAVESFNAGLWSPRNNALAAQFAAAHGLPVVGGSDSHHLPTVGAGYTLFPGRTAADLRHAIVQRQTRAAGVMWGALRQAEVGAIQVRRGLSGLLTPVATTIS
ncbi:MAG: CehA/McbA family metallohydrolase [Chloroflexales bacterium]